MATKNESHYQSTGEFLSYDQDTGIFRWTKSRQKVRAGSVAGRVNSRGYRLIMVNGNDLKAHRLAFFITYGYLPANIDHINGNTDDNRICNLRECTKSQNQHNRRINANNKSGVSGVRWCEMTQMWISRICLNRKTIYLGQFDSIDDAKAARLAAELKYHGEFAASVCRS